MQEQIREIYSWRQSHGEKVMDIVISINTGEAIVGNIGSEKRMAYAAIGNVINMAFHLQEMSRGRYQILVTENPSRRIGDIVTYLDFKKHVNEQLP